jgi:hypothetical protein
VAVSGSIDPRIVSTPSAGSQACLASLSNGGYYGPFVESEGW